MKSIRTIFRFELHELFRQRGNWLGPIIVGLVLFALCFIPRFIHTDDDEVQDFRPGQYEENFFAEDERFGLFLTGGAEDDPGLTELPILREAELYDDEASLLDDFNQEKLKRAMILDRSSGQFKGTVYAYDVPMSDSFNPQLREILQSYQMQEALVQSDVDLASFYTKAYEPIELETIARGKDAGAGFIYSYLGLFMLYFTILSAASQVATNVAREKNNRTMELLITQVQARHLVLGKVFALLVVAFYGLIVEMIFLALGYLINHDAIPAQITSVIDAGITTSGVLLFVLMGLLGAALYFFLFAAVGSLVDRIEDVSSAMSPFIMMIVIAFVLSMGGMGFPDGRMMRIISQVPFTSPFAMTARNLMVSVAPGEILLSVGLLLGTTVLVAFVAIRIYREGSLSYGNKLSIAQALKRSYQK